MDLTTDLKKPLNYLELSVLISSENNNENIENILRTSYYRESIAYAKRCLQTKGYVSKDGYITALGTVAIHKSISMYKEVINEFESLAKRGTAKSKAFEIWYEAADSSSNIGG